MFCPQCSSKILPEAHFCVGCGHRLPEVRAESEISGPRLSSTVSTASDENERAWVTALAEPKPQPRHFRFPIMAPLVIASVAMTGAATFFFRDSIQKVVPVIQNAIQGEPTTLCLERTLLARIPKDCLYDYREICFSPNGRSVAYLGIFRTEGEAVFVGNKESSHFDSIVMGEYGKQIVYKARKDGRWHVVVGDKKSEPFDDVQIDPHLNRKGERVAYGAKLGDRWFVVANDKRSGEYDKVGIPIWSPTDDIVAYWGRKGDKICVIMGSRDSGFYDDVAVDRPWIGKEGYLPAYCFSSDGQTLAWCAKIDNRWVAIVGSTHYGEKANLDLAVSPTFSSHGHQVAYMAAKDGKWFIMVDDYKLKSYDRVGPPVFSADGRNVAYWAKHNDKWSVVAGDKTGDPFELNDEGSPQEQPVYSQTRPVVAYRVSRSDQAFVIVDGKKGEEFDKVSKPVFSPDGNTVAYMASSGNKTFVVAGGRKSEPFDWNWERSEVTTPRFSQDGKKICFGARHGDELWWEVMDLN